jgi:hypothetical protein
LAGFAGKEASQAKRLRRPNSKQLLVALLLSPLLLLFPFPSFPSGMEGNERSRSLLRFPLFAFVPFHSRRERREGKKEQATPLGKRRKGEQRANPSLLLLWRGAKREREESKPRDSLALCKTKRNPSLLTFRSLQSRERSVLLIPLVPLLCCSLLSFP